MRLTTLCVHLPLAQRRKPTTITTRSATLCGKTQHFLLTCLYLTSLTLWLHWLFHFTNSLTSLPAATLTPPLQCDWQLSACTSPSTAPQTYHPKPPWHHHHNAICSSLHALPPSTAPQTHHPKPPWHHHYNAIHNLWFHFPMEHQSDDARP